MKIFVTLFISSMLFNSCARASDEIAESPLKLTAPKGFYIQLLIDETDLEKAKIKAQVHRDEKCELMDYFIDNLYLLKHHFEGARKDAAKIIISFLKQKK